MDDSLVHHAAEEIRMEPAILKIRARTPDDIDDEQQRQQQNQLEANLLAKGTLRRFCEVVTSNEAGEVHHPGNDHHHSAGPNGDHQLVGDERNSSSSSNNNNGDLTIAAGTTTGSITTQHDRTGTEMMHGKEGPSSDADAGLAKKGQLQQLEQHRPLQHQATNDTIGTTTSSSSSSSITTDPPNETTVPGAWAVSGIALRPELVEDLSATAPSSTEDGRAGATSAGGQQQQQQSTATSPNEVTDALEEGLAQATPVSDSPLLPPDDMQRAYPDVDDLSTLPGDSRHSSRSTSRSSSSTPSKTFLAGVFAVALLLVVVVAVVVAVLVLQQGKDQQQTAETTTDTISMSSKQERDMEVRNRIMGALDVMSGSETARDALQDSNSPHSKALRWILYDDEMELSATANNLLQRYVVALLYYSTTQDGPWTSCNPPDQEEEEVEEENEENLLCYYYGLNGDGLWQDGGLAYTYHQRDTHQELLATRWLTGGQHECQWAGLFCNDDNKLDWIQLDEMNMTGKIVKSLPHHHYLLILLLALLCCWCNLTSCLPNELSILEDLETLSLIKNSLHGPLAPGLGRLSKLEFLNLQQNDLSGTIPNEWWGLTNLRHINLSYNPLNAWTIPPMISQWSNLQILRVEGNQITGEIPKELYHLSDLNWLLLGSNTITGTVATQFGRLSNLEMLNIGGNLLSGSIPSELSAMTDLMELAAFGLLLSGTIPEEFYLADYTKLNALVLGKNHFTGTISSSIGRLSTLGYFYLDQNPYIEGTLPSEIGLLKNLRKLVVSGTQLSGTIPQEICDNRGNSFLARLKADCEPLSDGHIPLVCPEGCCTKCCNQETGQCTKTIYQDADPLQ